MRYAAIDIGSNTVLLLVADYERPKFKVLFEEQRAPRLGKGVDESGNLAEDSIKNVLKVLQEYKEILLSQFPEVEKIIVTATSAVRDAKNRAYLLRSIENQTGFKVCILSGKEEAEYTYKGALSVLNHSNSPYSIIDIGGGSTEISMGTGNELGEVYSYDTGCVRFTERYLHGNPPLTDEIYNCRKAIKKVLQGYSFDVEPEAQLIAVAGTATSLACIDLGIDNYIPDKINGYRIDRSQIRYFLHELQAYSSEELLKEFPSVMKGRSDIFYAGLLILIEVMDYLNADELMVSVGGIRHGAILSLG